MLGACVDRTPPPAVCERGRARNLDDGSCVTSRDARDLARGTGVYVGEDDVIGCEATADELVASTRLGKIGCVAREPSPLLSSSCPAGSLRLERDRDCMPLAKAGLIDLSSWSAAAAREACTRLLRSPLVLASSETTLSVELRTSVPNNDPTLGYVRLETRPVVPEADVVKVADALGDALRRLVGTAGTASASDLTSAATCRASVRRPISVP